jgi:hypothetical protein
MRVFLSHASRDKPLVREIRRHLPEHVTAWIDEQNLLFGEDLEQSLRRAITSDSDFLLLFISQDSVQSEWVGRELKWALARERRIGRTFVLPVLLDREAWDEIEPEEFRRRKYLLISDFSEPGVADLASRIKDELFAWVSRHLEVESWNKRRDESSMKVALLEGHGDVPLSMSLRIPLPKDMVAKETLISVTAIRDPGHPDYGLVRYLRSEGGAVTVMACGYQLAMLEVGSPEADNYEEALANMLDKGLAENRGDNYMLTEKGLQYAKAMRHGAPSFNWP